MFIKIFIDRMDKYISFLEDKYPNLFIWLFLVCVAMTYVVIESLLINGYL